MLACMDTDFFTVERLRGGLVHLRLNRPERLNTMTPAFFPAVRDAVNALNAEGATRVLLVSAAGKHFSAGMALDVFAGGGELAINYAVDHPTAEALDQMTLLQSAVFDLDEMGRAIAAWKGKTAGQFEPLPPVKAV